MLTTTTIATQRHASALCMIPHVVRCAAHKEQARTSSG